MFGGDRYLITKSKRELGMIARRFRTYLGGPLRGHVVAGLLPIDLSSDAGPSQ